MRRLILAALVVVSLTACALTPSTAPRSNEARATNTVRDLASTDTGYRDVTRENLLPASSSHRDAPAVDVEMPAASAMPAAQVTPAPPIRAIDRAQPSHQTASQPTAPSAPASGTSPTVPTKTAAATASSSTSLAPTSSAGASAVHTPSSAPSTSSTSSAVPLAAIPAPIDTPAHKSPSPPPDKHADVELSTTNAESTRTPVPVPVFEIHVGDTLRSTITRWANSVGWTLIWQGPVDYTIEAPMTFSDDTGFLDAVRQTVGSFWSRTQTISAAAYKNKVLVVNAGSAP